MTVPLKVLFFDLETAPLLAHVWRPWDSYIPHKAMRHDSFLLTWAVKWRGVRRVRSEAIGGEEARNQDDSRLVLALADIVRQADVLVAHNVDRFDWPRLNGRLLTHGIDPIQPPRTIDTLKLAKKNFGFAYNKLDYLAHELGIGEKIDTDFELWARAYKGDTKALRAMERYNRHDVVLLEGIFERFLPYVRNLPPLVDAEREMEHACPSCGSVDLQKRGFHRTNASSFQTWQCNPCGRYSRTRSASVTKKLKLHPL